MVLGSSSQRAVIQLLRKIETGERIVAQTGKSPALPLIHTDDISYIGRELLRHASAVYNVSAPQPYFCDGLRRNSHVSPR